MAITAIDSSIPMAGINPVKTLGDLANVNNLNSEVALRAQQGKQVEAATQAQNLAIQQQKMDMDDNEKLRQHLSDPTNAEAFGKGDMTSLYKLGLQPKILMGAQKSLIDARESAAKLDTTTLDNNAKRHGQFQQTIDGILKLPEDQRATAYTGALQSMGQAGLLKGMNLPPTIDTSDEALKKLAAANGIYSGIYEGAQKDKKAEAELAKTQADTSKLTADAEAARAGIPTKEAEGQIKQAQANNMSSEGLLPEEQAKAQQSAAQLAQTQATARETARHNLSSESTARLNASISAGHLAQTQMVNNMKYGPDTTAYWVQQLQQSPDSIKEMPPEMRTNVGKQFTAVTGLPLPTPASTAGQATEMAARNALDGAAFIRNALKNPAIANNLGPIMGRLGEGEQALGTSLHLSPEDAKLAQEVRTRMKYFVFQEGKAILGGRLPQQLMKSLEESSANVHMDPSTLAGALSGAEGNARGVVDNVERSRFGGQMRQDSTRHLAGSTVKLRAPNGQEMEVSPSEADHYLKLGAKVVH